MTKKVNKVKAQPFLRWAGSKKKILQQLSAYYRPDYKRYVEPFAGSASLFFKLKPKRAILGDINNDLISTYREIKYRFPEVIRELRKLKKGKRQYYQLRQLDASTLTSAQKAARFIYLNRYCFNGLYRTNMKGQFNVPYGGYKSGSLPSKVDLQECANSLKNTTIISGSFEKTLQKVQTGDFVYIDPPYSMNSRRVFNEYSNINFGDDELKSLRLQLIRLDKIGVYFLVSYGLSKEARELARGFKTREVKIHRQIAGFAANRRRYKDLLITNY